MTQQHPITPPPELRWLWAQQAQRIDLHDPVAWMQYVSEKAAQWGADQELEACCEWIPKATPWDVEQLRAARRPKPPSLKEQALQALYRFDDTQGHEGLTPEQIADDFVLIRRALEQLPDSIVAFPSHC